MKSEPRLRLYTLVDSDLGLSNADPKERVWHNICAFEADSNSPPHSFTNSLWVSVLVACELYSSDPLSLWGSSLCVPLALGGLHVVRDLV